jgi:hypothetical protein
MKFSNLAEIDFLQIKLDNAHVYDIDYSMTSTTEFMRVTFGMCVCIYDII